MSKNSQGGFAQVIVLLILVIGVVVGIYLVQHPQIFKPKASVSGPVSGPIDDSTTPPTGRIKMTLSNASSDGNHVAWATRGAQSAPFQLNKTYKISFWYRSNVTSELRMRDNGLITLNPAENVTYYTTTKTLTQNFNGQPCNNYGGDNMCYLLFHLYGNGYLEIGSLKIEEVDSGNPNMISNTTYNSSSWSGWSVCIPDWRGTCSVDLTGTPSNFQDLGNKALRVFLTNSSPDGNHVVWANRGGQSVPFQLNRTYTFYFSYRSSVVFDLRMRDNGIETFNPTSGPDEVKVVKFSKTFTTSYDGAPCNNYGGDNQCYLLLHMYGDGYTEIRLLKIVDEDSGTGVNLMTETTYNGSSWADWSVCLPDWKGTCQVFNPVVSYGLSSSPSPSATPTPTIQAKKRIFITSVSYDGNLGGISGADAKCQAVAEASNLNLDGTWKAWVSNSFNSTAPANTFNKFSGPYKLTNGMLVANNWDDLVDGSIENPINITENQAILDTNVWSNTSFEGNKETNQGCQDWVPFHAPTNNGRYGKSNATDFQWTASGTQTCNLQASLYCFEQ